MVHGGDIYRNCISLDYSVNINPLGIPASVEAALKEAVSLCSRYPDIRQEKLKAAIAEMDKVAADEILCGNGASELFPAILHALKPKKILIPVPSFYGYEWAAGTEACEVSYFPLREQDNFVLGEDFIEALDKETELIYLANPNNPTGQLISPEILKGILKRCQELDIIVVVDECFLPFCEEAELYEEMEAGMKCRNLIQVRIYQDLCHTGSPAGLSYLPEQGSLSEDCKAASGMELIGICPDGRMRCSKRNGIYRGKQKTHKRAAEYSDKRADILRLPGVSVPGRLYFILHRAAII